MPDRLEPPKILSRDRRTAPVKPDESNVIRDNKKSFLSKSEILTLGGIDIPFFAIVIGLVTIGLVMLFSATYPYALSKLNDSYYYTKRQFVFVVAGIILMLLISKMNYRIIQKFVYWLFGLTVILLIVVLFHHTDFQDFRRWIPIGPFTFQPSDLAKFTVIVVLADYISKNYKKMKHVLEGTVYPLIIIAIFCILIYFENHNSGMVLVFLIGATLMFCGGSDWKLFALGAGLVAAIAIFVITNPEVLQQYAGERIVAWLDKDYDPLDARWQTNNSLYAIGSGGFFGAGLGNSKQKFMYVSEPQNDFIFSIVCEELGFVGAAVIIFLFALLFIRGIKIALKSRDRFATLLVIGIVSQVAIQTVFNILVVTDTIPNTGIALPFFSYGGTSILLLLMEMGVVLSVSRSTNQKKV